MNVANFATTVKGEYRFVVTRGGQTVEDTGWFDNLILDQGLDRMGSAFQTPIFSYCRVGTGNSTPVVTQVALDSQIATTTSVNSTASTGTNEGSPLYRTTLTYNFAFAQGAVIGNITEVGVGWAQTGNTLFSRALILDNVGSPTTITLVAIDQLTVYYRLRVAPTLTDLVGTAVISGTPYGFTSRVANAGSFGNVIYLMSYGHEYIGGPYPNPTRVYNAGATLGAITASGPTGTQPSTPEASSGTLQPYSNGTYYRDTVWTWGIGNGNATGGGIQAIVFVVSNPYQSFRFQVRFDTPIPKASTNVLTLSTRFSWARA